MPVFARRRFVSRSSAPPSPIGRGCRSPLILALALLATPALADPRMAGRFTGRGEGHLELKVVDGSRSRNSTIGGEGGYRVEASTGIRNTCSGDLSGLARETAPRTLLLREPADDGETCELTLRFSADYAHVTMSEEKCLYFHGTDCAFDGILLRRR